MPAALLTAALATGCTTGTPAPTTGGDGGATTGSAPGSNALATWQRALDDRADEPATWLAIGDSLTEGQGASTRGARWLDLARADLRERFPTDGVPGGEGYLPARFAVQGPDSPWASWATASTAPLALQGDVPSFGHRSVDLEPGRSVTYAVTGDGLDLWWAPGGGTATWSVDGGAPETVDTGTGTSGGATDAAPLVTEVEGLAPGDHAVTVTAQDAVGLEGLTAYDGDRDAGIVTVDSARTGATIGTFLDDPSAFLERVERVRPDLVTLSLGINDAAQGRTPDQIADDYRAVLDGLRGVGSSPSVVVLGEFVPGTSADGALPSPLADYTAAVRGAAEEAGAEYVGLEGALPADGLEGLLSADGLHPSDAGQRRVADLVVGVLAD
ncbi:SGNH/GDSL hydrolase family protein [Frigoribacterium salinisoli]